MADNEDDKKVKELIDAATRAELERWFGLPSFQELSDRGITPQPPAPPAEDPEMVAARERLNETLRAIDPAMLEAHRRRTEPRTDLLRFTPQIEVRVDPDIAQLDMAMIDRRHAIAEPRELERPEDLQDQLQDRTPQALLRDLHRPELNFDKYFEVIDYAAEQRIDAVAAVADAMRTRWTLPPLRPTPLEEARAVLRAGLDERRMPWADLKIRNRRVTG
jgi:hypothetical protein